MRRVTSINTVVIYYSASYKTFLSTGDRERVICEIVLVTRRWFDKCESGWHHMLGYNVLASTCLFVLMAIVFYPSTHAGDRQDATPIFSRAVTHYWANTNVASLWLCKCNVLPNNDLSTMTDDKVASNTACNQWPTYKVVSKIIGCKQNNIVEATLFPTSITVNITEFRLSLPYTRTLRKNNKW